MFLKEINIKESEFTKPYKNTEVKFGNSKNLENLLLQYFESKKNSFYDTSKNQAERFKIDLIIGNNGSGKSRLFELINNNINNQKDKTLDDVSIKFGNFKGPLGKQEYLEEGIFNLKVLQESLTNFESKKINSIHSDLLKVGDFFPFFLKFFNSAKKPILKKSLEKLFEKKHDFELKMKIFPVQVNENTLISIPEITSFIDSQSNGINYYSKYSSEYLKLINEVVIAINIENKSENLDYIINKYYLNKSVFTKNYTDYLEHFQIINDFGQGKYLLENKIDEYGIKKIDIEDLEYNLDNINSFHISLKYILHKGLVKSESIKYFLKESNNLKKNYENFIKEIQKGKDIIQKHNEANLQFETPNKIESLDKKKDKNLEKIHNIYEKISDIDFNDENKLEMLDDIVTCISERTINNFNTKIKNTENNKKISEIISAISDRSKNNSDRSKNNFAVIAGSFNGELFLDKNTSFSKLSSGETLILIRFINTLLQIEKTKKDEGISNFVILIDEPDLHLHLDWQRQYISKLLDFYSILQLDINIQFIIATHSPFLASDLPKDCISIVKNGEIIKFSEEENKNEKSKKNNKLDTKIGFAANYIDIIDNGFFFKGKYLIGEFSKELLEDIAKYNRLISFISMIGINNEKKYQEKKDYLEDLIDNKIDIKIPKTYTELLEIKERVKEIESEICNNFLKKNLVNF